MLQKQNRGLQLTFHIRQVKPRHVAALDQRLVDPLHRGLRIPLVWTNNRQESVKTQLAIRALVCIAPYQSAIDSQHAQP
jgi:hypothetical protein